MNTERVDIGRRRVLAGAALGREIEQLGPIPGCKPPLETIIGEVRDVTKRLMIVENVDGAEERLVIAPWATAWRGGAVQPAELGRGARVIVRALRSGRVVDRVWADITRMTGTILSITRNGRSGRRGHTVELDCGPHRGRRRVLVPSGATGPIQVRHPRLEPGYLFDAIGVRVGGASTALLPATSQPAYRADSVPPPSAYGTQPRISGAAVWSDVFDDDEAGAAYPMLEHADARCDQAGFSCAGLPYLSLGSTLSVHNLCTDRAAVLPIVACGCLTGRFRDRCVECGTSPRGRTVELSPLAYVELGGELTRGCFNARIGLG
jgi:hypothetical protein